MTKKTKNNNKWNNYILLIPIVIAIFILIAQWNNIDDSIKWLIKVYAYAVSILASTIYIIYVIVKINQEEK